MSVSECVCVCVCVCGARRTEAESCDATQPPGLNEAGFGGGAGQRAWTVAPGAQGNKIRKLGQSTRETPGGHRREKAILHISVPFQWMPSGEERNLAGRRIKALDLWLQLNLPSRIQLFRSLTLRARYLTYRMNSIISFLNLP